MYCQNCGCKLNDQVKFCPQCGALQEQAPKQSGGSGKSISWRIVILLAIPFIILVLLIATLSLTGDIEEKIVPEEIIAIETRILEDDFPSIDGEPFEQEATEQIENTVPSEAVESDRSDSVNAASNRETSGWEEAPLRLSKAVRYVDGNLYDDYTIRYDTNNRVTEYTVRNYLQGTNDVCFTNTWEYTYDNIGNILKEFSRTSQDQTTTYEYFYIDGKPVQCKMFVDSTEFRTYTIDTDDYGHVISVDGTGVYDAGYTFSIDYTYGSDMVPVSAIGSLTMSYGTTKKLYDYTYHPAMIQVDVTYKNEGKEDIVHTHFRMDDDQLLSLPEFYVDDDGSFEVNDAGYITRILDEQGSLKWELTYEEKENVKSAVYNVRNRRVARINEYNAKGTTKTHTFTYGKEGWLERYTTTYFDKGTPMDKDTWTFGYYNDGHLFDESRDWGEEDYLKYIHIRDEDFLGHQILYGRGIQQRFDYDYNEDGTIYRIRGEGVHDYSFKSDMTYTYDKRKNAVYSSGTLSGSENTEYQISKTYDFSYEGVVIVNDKTVLNGKKLPASRYLRIDMPEYIGLPEVVFHESDMLITDDDGYIVKILDKNGALRCELIFDYC